MSNKYAGLESLRTFLAKLKTIFADITHNHNDIYYTKIEQDEALSQKSQVQIVTWGVDD